MLKKILKSIIIKKIVVIAGIFVIFAAPAFSESYDEGEEFTVKPMYIFKNSSNRDPFVPRYENATSSVMESVSIATLVLQGITRSDNVTTALFKSQNGNDFGYILIDSELFGDNNIVIPDITGEIISDTEVKLIQGNREIVFKLSEKPQPGAMNIRPEE